jgi:hypothetical protein
VSDPSRSDAVSTAKGLRDSVESLADEVRGLAAAGRRSRVLIVVVFVLIAAVIAAGAVAGFAIEQAASARADASAVHTSNLVACRAGNQSRAQQIALWDHVAAISTPPPHSTQAQIQKNKRVIAAFLAYVGRVFAPRDCQALYRV